MLISFSDSTTVVVDSVPLSEDEGAARAFHAAESGLSEAFNTNAAWDISGDYEAVAARKVRVQAASTTAP